MRSIASAGASLPVIEFVRHYDGDRFSSADALYEQVLAITRKFFPSRTAPSFTAASKPKENANPPDGKKLSTKRKPWMSDSVFMAQVMAFSSA